MRRINFVTGATGATNANFWFPVDEESAVQDSYEEIVDFAGLSNLAKVTSSDRPAYKFTYASSDLDGGLSWREQGVGTGPITIEERS